VGGLRGGWQQPEGIMSTDCENSGLWAEKLLENYLVCLFASRLVQKQPEQIRIWFIVGVVRTEIVIITDIY
jgi:hypothetical protein